MSVFPHRGCNLRLREPTASPTTYRRFICRSAPGFSASRSLDLEARQSTRQSTLQAAASGRPSPPTGGRHSCRASAAVVSAAAGSTAAADARHTNWSAPRLGVRQPHGKRRLRHLFFDRLRLPACNRLSTTTADLFGCPTAVTYRAWPLTVRAARHSCHL